MKLFLKGLLVLCICCGAVGFSEKKSSNDDMNDIERKYFHCQMKYSTFDEVLDTSDIVFSGEVKAINKSDTKEEYMVKVLDKYRGDCEKELIVENNYFEYTTDNHSKMIMGRTKTDYKVGEKYIFILQHIVNVYEDRYTIISDAYIPLNHIENSSILSERMNIENIEKYIKKYKYKDSTGDGKEVSIDYIESDKLSVIAKESKYIVKIKIDNLLYSSDISDVYTCSVLKRIKGNIVTVNNQIIVPFFKNSVMLGKEYIVALDSETKDSIIYTLSSKNSMLEQDKEREIDSILKGE